MTACGAAFRQGWKQVKLYFMMGLPTETDEDVIGIARLAKKVVDLYTEIKGKRGVKVTISVACFVPKPYTPFQWFGQVPLAEFERRQHLLKEHITDRAITFNYHDARLSVIEGAFARGDRRLARVLEQAWRDGAKFDGWTDLFQYDIWQEAFKKCGIDIRDYSERTRAFDEPLPWEVTSPGATKDFFLREWQKAMQGQLTEDCRRGKCSACGICPNLGVHVIDYKKQEVARGALVEKYVPQPVHPEKNDGVQPEIYWYRARVTKDAAVRFVSHLEYADVFVKAFDRAKLPMAYSSGFNPHMKLAFGSALAVGVSSEAEYMDFALKKPLAQPEVFDRLSAQLPPGVRVLALRPVRGKHVALMAQADAADYRVRVPLLGDPTAAAQAARQALASFRAAPEVFVTRVTPKKTRRKEIKQYLKGPLTVSLADGVLTLSLTTRIFKEAGSVKPGEILAVLVESFGLPVRVAEADIHRTALTGGGKDLIDLVG